MIKENQYTHYSSPRAAVLALYQFDVLAVQFK